MKSVKELKRRVMQTQIEIELVHKILKVVSDQYSNKYISFYTWITYNADIEFITIYEQTLKDSKLGFDYGTNLSNAIWSFYEVERDISKLNNFIKKFVNCQMKSL